MDTPHGPRLHGDGIALLTPDPDWWTIPSTRILPCHELFYVVTGSLDLDTAAGRLLLSALQWGLVPPHTQRDTNAAGATDLAIFVVQWVDPVPATEGIRHGDDSGGRLLTLLHWLLETVRGGRPAAPGTDFAGVLLPAIIAALAPATPGPDRGIGRAVALMREQPQRRLRLADLAGYAGMSRETFLRHFSAQVGSTPNRFLTQVRLERACALLRETDLPLGTIAKRCGWHDAPRLCRVFARHLGRKPGDLRRQSGCGAIAEPAGLPPQSESAALPQM